MSAGSKIEWTDQTWNPIVGCSIVSPGCTNCYAMKTAARLEKMLPSERRGDVVLPNHYAALTAPSKAGPVWTGRVNIAPEHILLKPMSWKKPRMIFVNSMGDLFHESIPDEWIDRVFAVMALCPQHTFQVLTKRAERMRVYIAATGPTPNHSTEMRVRWRAEKIKAGGYKALRWPLPNVWLGVSAERQQEADERIPLLLQTPAAVRFVSCEPLLGPVDLTDIPWPKDRPRFPDSDDISDARSALHLVEGSKLDWVIAGGESGHRARLSQPDFFRSLRDQCNAADVPFFFKQWGEYLPVGQVLPGHGVVTGATAVKPGRMKLHYRGAPHEAPKHAFAARGVTFASTDDGYLTFRVGKKKAGRTLDGVVHDAFPEVRG